MEGEAVKVGEKPEQPAEGLAVKVVDTCGNTVIGTDTESLQPLAFTTFTE